MNLAKRRVAKLKLSLIILFFILLIWSASKQTGVSLVELFSNLSNMGALLAQMFPPDWSYFNYVTSAMLETIRMAVLGTTFGGIVAIPFALFASRNIVKKGWIAIPFRFVMNLIRTIPELLLAALFVPIFGIGFVSGIFALAVFSFGVIAKLAYESIEAIDKGPLEAMTAVGANKLQWIFLGVIPQVVAPYMSYFLYCFEINVRAATILGYVGAGGIGLYLSRTLGFLQYDRVMSIILYTFVVVLIIDGLSNRIREKLI
ncbi:MAG: phosphonate ABC transporter, permease protein PhnE [Sporolactobacillus sp.]|uniref:phosphonate ABC transporter, permease protein PhnE n=1 Tax=Sporolactobacillus sp. STSJ-5 TaxID=2965076 RepID=UPI00210344C4|nr:phosphonate ABC transporter, permease protein PhnE [Sporolactobacillus sp. STSJ-5]